MQPLKSKAGFLRAQSETFSLVRIIIVPCVWHRHLIANSVLRVWKSIYASGSGGCWPTSLEAATTRRRLSQSGRPPHAGTPRRDRARWFPMAATAGLVLQVGFALHPAPASLTAQCLIPATWEKRSAPQHFFHCTTLIHAQSSSPCAREEKELK